MALKTPSGRPRTEPADLSESEWLERVRSQPLPSRPLLLLRRPGGT